MAEVLTQDVVGAGLFGAAVLWAVFTLSFARVTQEPPPAERDDGEQPEVAPPPQR